MSERIDTDSDEARMERAEEALRDICLLVSDGEFDPADGEGTSPDEVTELVRAERDQLRQQLEKERERAETAIGLNKIACEISHNKQVQLDGLRESFFNMTKERDESYGHGVSAGKLEALNYTPEERERYGKYVSAAEQNDALRQQLELVTRERDEAQRQWREDFEVRTHLLAERDALLRLVEDPTAPKTWNGMFEDNTALHQRVAELEAALRIVQEAIAENDAYHTALDDVDGKARQFEKDGDMYGWNFWKGVRSGIVNRSISEHVARQAIRAALATPAPDGKEQQP